MPLNINDNWLRAFADGTPEPVHLVTIQLGARAFLTVLNYAAGGTDTFSVYVNGALALTRTEGTDFDAETSNAQTAANIAEAINSALDGVNAYSVGAVVVAVVAPGTEVTFTTGDAAAWAVTPAPDQTGEVTFCSGGRPLFGHSAGVAELKPIGAELDPITREASSGDRSIVFDDEHLYGPIRALMVSHTDLAGKLVQVRLGAVGLAETDFIGDGLYLIQEVTPSQGRVELRCSDAAGILKDQDVQLNIINQHPLEAVETILVRCQVPEDLYDATSLEPTAFPDIGHFIVTRGSIVNTNGQSFWGVPIDDPTNALELVNELCRLAGGSFLPDDTGVFAFRRYDFDASPEETWYEADVTNVEQPRNMENMANRVIVSGAPLEGTTRRLFQADDLNSQRRYTPAGQPGRRFVESIDARWLNGIGHVHFPQTIDAGTLTLTLTFAMLNGFCGTAFDRPPTDANLAGIAAGRNLSTDRPGYFLIFNNAGDLEYVRAVAASVAVPPNPQQSIASRVDPYTGDIIQVWDYVTFTLDQRGIFGTTAQAWTSQPTYVADATIAVDMVRRELQRRAHGMPVIELDTDFDKYRIAVGDKIALNHPRYLNHGANGADGTVRFEVTRKEADPRGSPPRIHWELTYGEDTVLRPRLEVIPPPVLPTFPPSVGDTNNVLADADLVVDSSGNQIVWGG